MTAKCYLYNYLSRIEAGKPGISQSIAKTIDAVIQDHIEGFSYQEHMTGLLMGEVQSGKTAQMFGILGAAADLGFKLFVLLTTDNVYLQQQTYKRALADLEEDFNICDETDADRLIQGKLRRPTLIILKKNTNVLGTWRDNLASSGYCLNNPLFIFDDEADAASLNTKVNQKQQSTINQHLESIRDLFNSSIYLQVTATPQSVLLQCQKTKWRPNFIHYFSPGKGYLGGNFFYSEPKSFVVRVTEDNELDELLEGIGLTDGLEKALLAFLVTGTHQLSSETTCVCNFLIHPSVRIEHHEIIAEKVIGYLKQLPVLLSDDSWLAKLKATWNDLQSTKPNLMAFTKVVQYLLNEGQNIKVIIMNSQQEIATYDLGMSVIVGGNSLGRGVTFPILQTVYYCRSAKRPQADTFWQHCRMFGYDRDPNLMRIFLPQALLDLFTELNNANQMLIEQICETSIENISLLYPTNVNPTRKSVIDKELSVIIAGGNSYFPRDPKQDNADIIDTLLASFADGEYDISYQKTVEILEHCGAYDLGLWGSSAFTDCVKALAASGDDDKNVCLIIRRGRNVSKETGTLISQSDRTLGNKIINRTVLTLYRLEGKKEQNWLGQPFWIPNIKFSKGKNFYLILD